MADILCGYTADRDDVLMAYLYAEIEPAQRAAFETHIATCERCRHELSDLRDVRTRLQAWTAPEAIRSVATAAPATAGSPGIRRSRVRTLLHEVPRWAQVAAALLFLGVSAGVANLDVRYDGNGLSIRTGWSRPAEAQSVNASGADPLASAQAPPWRAEIEALEQRLRSESRSNAATAHHEAETSGAEIQLIRKVRALIQESERRQQNGLALQIAEVARDFDIKRGTDLANIDRSLRTIQSNTGIEVARTQQYLNYLTRVSMQK